MSNSATPWTVAHKAPLSMRFSRQEYWSGWPCPPPGDLPNPGIEPAAPAQQVDSLLLSPWVSPNNSVHSPLCLRATLILLSLGIISFWCNIISNDLHCLDFLEYHVVSTILCCYAVNHIRWTRGSKNVGSFGRHIYSKQVGKVYSLGTNTKLKFSGL